MNPAYAGEIEYANSLKKQALPALNLARVHAAVLCGTAGNTVWQIAQIRIQFLAHKGDPGYSVRRSYPVTPEAVCPV